MSRKLTAVLLIAAAVSDEFRVHCARHGVQYPDVLKEPVEAILAKFRASQAEVVAWLSVLALSAALFAPIAVGIGKLSARRAMRVAVPVGIAAAVVQVIGLSRWPLLVPRLADNAASLDPVIAAQARDNLVLAHRILGTLIGETLGYILTAAWTLLVLVALRRTWAGLWFTVLGCASAVLILAGVLSTLDLPVIDLANFIGYVLWSIWLVVFAVLILRRPRQAATTTESTPAITNR